MIYLTEKTEIQLAVEPVSFKNQIDGLIELCEQQFKKSANTGVLYVFINRARTMIRILCYQHNGYWLATKRLSRGRYRGWPTHAKPLSRLEASRLVTLLKGALE
jgi:hypothetical protein